MLGKGDGCGKVLFLRGKARGHSPPHPAQNKKNVALLTNSTELGGGKRQGTQTDLFLRTSLEGGGGGGVNLKGGDSNFLFLKEKGTGGIELVGY